MSDSEVPAGAQNFGDDEQNVVDIQLNEFTAPKRKNRVQIVTSSATKSDDRRPKSDHTIRMRGNVLIQNPAQEWKVRSCELNGSFLTFFRKQKMVAAIDLEQVGDIQVLRQINDSSGQGFIFSLHLKEGRYFNVRVSMHDDAQNWVKVLVETRDKLRSHQSRSLSTSTQNESNYTGFTPLAADLNSSMIVAEEPDDNIKVYFDYDQFPPSPIFEANEKYVRPLQSNKLPSQSSLGSPGSTISNNSGKFGRAPSITIATNGDVRNSQGNLLSPLSSPGSGSMPNKVKFDLSPVSAAKTLVPRTLNDDRAGGFGREVTGPVPMDEQEQEQEQAKGDEEEGPDQDAQELEEVPESDAEANNENEQAQQAEEEEEGGYQSVEETERRALAAVAERAQRDYLDAERLAADQAEEERLAAMIQSARAARENAEKVAQAKAAREEKMREEQALRMATIAAEKAAEEEQLALERAAKEARFAAERTIREKKAAAEKLAREKQAAEEERVAAERAQRIAEREVAAKRKVAEQAMAAKEAEKLDRLRVHESAERKAKHRAERRGSAPPGIGVMTTLTPTEVGRTGPTVTGSLLAEDSVPQKGENTRRYSAGQARQPELNLDGLDVTQVDSPLSSPSGGSRRQSPKKVSLADPQTSFYNADGSLRPLPESLSPRSLPAVMPPVGIAPPSATKAPQFELTVENVNLHTSNSSARTNSTTDTGTASPVSAILPPVLLSSERTITPPLPSSFDEVYDSVPSSSATPRFRSPSGRRAASASANGGSTSPERKRPSITTSRPYSVFFQVCVGVVCLALLVLGALGGMTYYRRYQSEEAWRAQSLQQLQAVQPDSNARSAEGVSKSPSIGSNGSTAAPKPKSAAATSTSAPTATTEPNVSAKTATTSTSSDGRRAPATLTTNKPSLNSGTASAAANSLVKGENPRAVARSSNIVKRFLANLIRAPARFIANVFSKFTSLFK